MSEDISREESFKALMGLVVLQPEQFPAGIVQKLQSDSGLQEGLNEVLLEVCELGDALVAQLAIRAGANVNAKDTERITPAHWAAQNGLLSCLKLLFECGAEINAESVFWETPAHLAAKYGQTECLTFLLEHGAEVNAKTTDGFTPTHAAAMKGHLESLKLLIKHGANVNAQEQYGGLAAHRAIKYQHLDCLELFLQNGVDVNAKDIHGRTLREVAEDHGLVDSVKFIDNWIAAHLE